jgi:hypothetical protein
MFSPALVRRMQMERQHLAPGTRGRTKSDLLAILKEVGGVYWLEPLYHRMDVWTRAWFDSLRWRERKIAEGRFFGGTLQYIPTDELPVYFQALVPKPDLRPEDRRVMEVIETHGPLTRDDVITRMGRTAPSIGRRTVEESLRRLDLGFHIVRCAWKDVGTWGQPVWDVRTRWLPRGIDLESIDPERAREALVLKFVTASGPLTVSQLAALFKHSLTLSELGRILGLLSRGCEVVCGRFVNGARDEQYAREEDVASLKRRALTRGAAGRDFVRILNQGDPFVTRWRAELTRLFGLRRPSAPGPAWLAYIFRNEDPVGVVDYKWRTQVSQINNLRLLPRRPDAGTFSMLMWELEHEAVLMHHKRIEVRQLNDAPPETNLRTSLGKMLSSLGYVAGERMFVKDLAEPAEGGQR